MKNEIIIFENQEVKLEVNMQDETVWLNTKQMSLLFDRDYKTIRKHINNALEEELKDEKVVAKIANTTEHGAIIGKTQTHMMDYYNLDVIISVGYRVKSQNGIIFRKWANERLSEYMIKGFTMNNDLLKRAGGGIYFDELLSRIRDIRLSEKVFWRNVLDIYATSVDYDSKAKVTQKFFKNVQNKMHWAVHGHTAAEIIVERDDSNKDFMGLTTFING